jgi:hypothetical protein
LCFSDGDATHAGVVADDGAAAAGQTHVELEAVTAMLEGYIE